MVMRKCLLFLLLSAACTGAWGQEAIVPSDLQPGGIREISLPRPGEYVAKIFSTRNDTPATATESIVVKAVATHASPRLQYSANSYGATWLQNLGFIALAVTKAVVYPYAPDGYNPDD